MFTRPRLIHDQHGQSLIEFVVVLGLFAIFLATALTYWRSYQIQQRADTYGQTLAQFAAGERSYISAVQGGTITPFTGTVTGVNWLKPTTCGGTIPTATGFIPCSFDGGPLGPSYQTTITQAGSSITLRTYFTLPLGFVTQAGLSEFAAETANAAQAKSAMPASGTFFNAYANVPINANGPVAVSAIAAADRGRVLAVVSNAATNDIWLRTDGTNTMLADFNGGGHNIVNVTNGSFSGNLTTYTLTTTNNATVGGNAGVTGNLNVTGATQLNGQVTINNNAQINGNVTLASGKNVSASDVYLQGLGMYASQGVLTGIQTFTGATGYTIAKPNCSAYGTTPAIYASVQNAGNAANAPTASGQTPSAIYESFVQYVDSGTYWTITPTLKYVSYKLTSTNLGNGNYTIAWSPQTYDDSAHLQILVMTKCR